MPKKKFFIWFKWRCSLSFCVLINEFIIRRVYFLDFFPLFVCFLLHVLSTALRLLLEIFSFPLSNTQWWIAPFWLSITINFGSMFGWSCFNIFTPYHWCNSTLILITKFSFFLIFHWLETIWTRNYRFEITTNRFRRPAKRTHRKIRSAGQDAYESNSWIERRVQCCEWLSGKVSFLFVFFFPYFVHSENFNHPSV